MKQTILFSLLILLSLSACKKEQVESQSAETSTAQEKPAVEDKVENQTTSTSPVDYSFDLYSALGYKIGDDAEENRYPKQLFLKKGVNKYMDEGETWQVPKTVVSDEDGVLIDLVHGFNERMKVYSSLVDEIVVHSKKLRNAEGIGVGSTLREFTEAYPYSSILYSYISDKIWIENAADGYRFYFDLPENLHKKVEVNSDLIEVPFDVVDENSKIRSIKINAVNYPHNAGITDLVGKWIGKDDMGSTIEVKIYEKDNNLFADVKTGEEVYQQFTEQLVRNGSSPISKPTSERKIIIDPQYMPRQIKFFMDDNPEFAPMRVKLSPAEEQSDTENDNKLSQNISSECYVLNFTEEQGRIFVEVQFIDMIENDENGFDTIEEEKRTFELTKEQFMGCRGVAFPIEKIKSEWEQLAKDDRQWYHITIENGYVTEFYFEDCIS